jgi:branched-subunit amino acid ABC-type transport system permease component
MMGGIQIYAFAAATLGGFGSPVGAVVGGFMVGIVENLVGTYVSFIGTELKLTVALAMIIIVLLGEADRPLRPHPRAARLAMSRRASTILAVVVVAVAYSCPST